MVVVESMEMVLVLGVVLPLLMERTVVRILESVVLVEEVGLQAGIIEEPVVVVDTVVVVPLDPPQQDILREEEEGLIITAQINQIQRGSIRATAK